jgi:hypothetical protein
MSGITRLPASHMCKHHGRTELGVQHCCGHHRCAKLREFRPRQGRSRWRPLYVIAGDEVRMIALAPEATHDPVGFRRAVDRAEDRLGEMVEQETYSDVE